MLVEWIVRVRALVNVVYSPKKFVQFCAVIKVLSVPRKYYDSSANIMQILAAQKTHRQYPTKSHRTHNNNHSGQSGHIEKQFDRIASVTDAHVEQASMHMSPGANTLRSSEMHSPKVPPHGAAEPATMTPQHASSMSPASASPRTMSPPAEHRNGFAADAVGGYQPGFTNTVLPYQTNVPPKKSFCIDALLSKSHRAVNGDHSPEANRFLSDDDTANKYSDDQREYMSSPEDGMSR